MAERRKSSKDKPNVEVIKVGSNNYVLFRPSDIYPGLHDKHALHIGNLDNNKVFHPSKVYFELTKDYKEALVFPSDWSLKNIPASNLSVSIRQQAQAEPTERTNKKKEKEELAPELKTIESQINNNFNRRINFGGTWLLYQTVIKLGIYEDLMNVFGNDREKVNRIFSLASFALMSHDDYDMVEDWQEENFLLTRAYLDYDRVISILSSVSAQDCEKFMLLRQQRIPKEDMGCLCVQTTAYHEKNFDSDNFEPTSSKEIFSYQDVVFYGLPGSKDKFLNGYDFSTKIPFYYAQIPSDLFDKKPNAKEILKVIDTAGLKHLDNFCLVSDCGEHALSDVDPLLRKGLKFQAKAYPLQEDIKRIIREDFPHPNEQSSQSPSLFDPHTDQYYYQEITFHRIKEDNTNEDHDPGYRKECVNEGHEHQAREVEIKTTVRLNTSAQEDWLRQISDELAEQTEKAQRALDQRIPITNREDFETDCLLLKFNYDKDTGTIVDFSHNDAKIEEEVLIAGFEAFRTFGFDAGFDEVSFLDSEYVIQDYILSGIKGFLGHNRFISDEKEVSSGKRLVTFIAMILSLYLEQLMEDNDVLKYGVEPSDLLREVNKIYACERVGKIYFAGKNISRYKQCLKVLGAELPKGVKLSSEAK